MVEKKDRLPFKEARKFVRSLGFQNREVWREYCKSGNKPDNIPSSPEKAYKNEWDGMPDWLGYQSRVVTNYNKLLSFKEARKFVRKLEFKKNSEWTTYCKSDQKPNNMPKYPDRAYKNEWLGWPDWLGYEEERWLPFKEARKFARSKEFTGKEDWEKFAKSKERPYNIPSNPQKAYPKEWKGSGDFLGTGTQHPRDIKRPPFEVVRKYALSLGLKGQKEWYEHTTKNKLPKGFPIRVDYYYKNKGWNDWDDFLDTGFIYQGKREYRPFKEAREIARKLAKDLQIKTHQEWVAAKRAGKIPDDIPTNPWQYYSKERKKK